MIKAKTAALSLGLLFALLHLIGIILIKATNGTIIEWAKGLHFVSFTFTVAPFSIATLIIGLIAAFIAGAIIGALFALIYNWVE